MSVANPKNVLCTHPNQYPKFETNVIPGTEWEIGQYGPDQFYAYLWNDEDSFHMSHIADEDGFDAVFTSRDEALKAIQETRAMDMEQPQ